MNVAPSRRRRSSDFAELMRSVDDPLLNPRADPICGDPVLLQRVTVADGYRLVLPRLSIDGDAIRGPDLVLTPVPPPDRAGFVVEDRESLPQLVGKFRCVLGHPVLLHQREHARLDRRERRLQANDGASFFFALDLLVRVAVHEEREQRAIGTARGLDDVRDVALVVRLIHVLELLAREGLVLREVEVAAVVHALDLRESQGAAEVEMDVRRGTRVVRQLFLFLVVVAQAIRREAEPLVPVHPPGAPLLEPLHVAARLDEELHLHLLELARAKNEISRRNLVAKRLADLRDPEGNALT